jgi:hypothetical protein
MGRFASTNLKEIIQRILIFEELVFGTLRITSTLSSCLVIQE